MKYLTSHFKLRILGLKTKGIFNTKTIPHSLFTIDHKARGFTLIELLVALVITGIMLTLVLSSYWTFLKTQQKMAYSREIQSEVRFAFSRLADKVRSSTIDYTQYQPGGQCVDHNHQLCLINPAGETYFFEFDAGANTLRLGPTSADTHPLLSPQKYLIGNLNFAISPQEDPKANLTKAQLQPKVTVFLRVKPRDGRYPDLEIENQTTISSRQY